MQANKAVEALNVTGDKNAAADQIKALYKTFTDSDCTMVEVRITGPYGIAATAVHQSVETCPAMTQHTLIRALTSDVALLSINVRRVYSFLGEGNGRSSTR